MNNSIEYFKIQLKRQVQFLKNSCTLFDNGQWEESIRIATSIRVILHDSKHSTSLLKHLDAKNINLYTTRTPTESKPGENWVTGFSMGVIILRPGQQKCEYGPDLRDYKLGDCVLPVEKWWEQGVWNLEPKVALSRKSIILSAANKDGGAHVDKDLDEDYKTLAMTTWGQIGDEKSPTKVIPIRNVHLVAIRTIANELIKSPDFLNLLGEAM